MVRAESNLEAVMLALRAAIAQRVQRVAFSISAELVSTTPVDTGWARANWVISIGEPVSAPFGSRESVDHSAQADGQARLLIYDLAAGDIFLNNNVPYIEVLNTGHSPQAPAGFIEAAIDRGISQAVAGVVS